MNDFHLTGIVSGYRSILEYVGQYHREGTHRTPIRAKDAIIELLSGYNDDPKEILGTTFAQDFDQMVLVRNIPFASLCEHHILPFTGKVSIGYLPAGGRIVGLSKMVRLVDCFSHRLQTQERMTKDIASAIMTHLDPLGAGVIAVATHSCMEIRGVKRSGLDALTSEVQGNFRTSKSIRDEFLSLVR